MVESIRLRKLVQGTQFAIAFRWPEVGFSFVGKSLKLVLDHESTNLRITFTESGASKTIGGTTTPIDSTAVVITNSNQRISWTRSKAFVTAHMPAGVYRGYIAWGEDADSLDLIAELQFEVATPKRGAI